VADKKVTPDVICDVIDGKYGNGLKRKTQLTEAGYDYEEVQLAVNEKIAEVSGKFTNKIWTRIAEYFAGKKIAKTLKKYTEYLFSSIDCEFEAQGKSMKAVDVSYNCGYFVFVFGNNSVVNFYFDELPGWKFGLWWNYPKSTKDLDKVTGTLFAQWEDEIDKFKPSQSNICFDIEVSRIRGILTTEISEIVEKLNDMVTNRYTNICNELGLEYSSEENAMGVFTKHLMQKSAYKTCEQFLDSLILDFVREHWLGNFTNAEIRYHINMYPHYDIVAPYRDNLDWVSEPGCYNIESQDGEFDMDEFNKLVESCEKIANRNGVYWHSPISCFDIYFTK
jgi:hypothetical protein